MSEDLHTFTPDWASPPGDTIVDILAHLHISKEELGREIGLSLVGVDELIEGVRAITPYIADRLETLLKTPSRFWLTREAQYRESLAGIHKKHVEAGL